MESLEQLDERLRELLIANGGDIDIDNYPEIINEARTKFELTPNDLSKRIVRIHATVDWKPFNKIDEMLRSLKVQLKGELSKDEAELIIKNVTDDLPRPKAIDYILSETRKWGFKTRERNAFEADAFENLWMTDEAWSKYQKESIVVEWLNEKARSLSELGEISYRKKNEAKYYLRNAASLGSLVSIITKSASKADVYSRIIESETDIDKRYLKVIYALNPLIPYKLNDKDFESIGELFDNTSNDLELFIAAANDYKKGYLPIWLNETDPLNALKLTTDYDYNSFLVFIFRVNPHHGIYLDDEKFATPELLIDKTKTDLSYWHKIIGNMQNGVLPIWFQGIGKQSWLDQYHIKTSSFVNNDSYTEEEKNYASVQTLIQIISNTIPDPEVAVNTVGIKLLSLEGSKPILKNIQITLQNFGFVKAEISLDHQIDGIKLSHGSATFFSLANMTSEDVLLEINPLKLIKNKIYIFNINVKANYKSIAIPVEIKVVFPKKAFVLLMLKYAVLGTIFFGGIRAILSVVTRNNITDLYLKKYLPYSNEYLFSVHYNMYFFVMLVFIVGLVGFYFIIKKAEKI